MKILFLNGSLEPGKDGVGDYTRRLAGELIRQGHECRIIALMDRFISEKRIEIQSCESTKVSVLRLPFENGYKYNSAQTRTWTVEFVPEWISIQYVPFMFNSRGLPLWLSSSLKVILNQTKIHIMFHELWVGMDTGSSIKLKLWGLLQKSILKSLLKSLKPDLVQTHAELYCYKLMSLGVHATSLPLFGNITTNQLPEKSLVLQKIQSKTIFFVMFGSIHFGSPIADFVSSLSLYGNLHNKSIEIKFIGKYGSFMAEWVLFCQNAGFIVKVLGQLSSSEVSAVLSSSDWGITTTPLLLTEKSGTVAAMFEHDLPVVNVARTWLVNGYQPKLAPYGVYVFNKDCIIDYLAVKSHKRPKSLIRNASLLMINLFKQFSCQV